MIGYELLIQLQPTYKTNYLAMNGGLYLLKF